MFPGLSDPERADELGAQWMEAVEEDFEQIVLHFHERFSEDIGELQATLDQFRPNRFEHMDEDDLARQFMHLWLMKIDRRVMLGDDGDSYLEKGAGHE